MQTSNPLPNTASQTMQTVAIEVTNEHRAEVQRRAYSLPVTIGRGGTCDIQLDPDNRAISRVHVEIVEEGGRTILYNRASNANATRVERRGLQPGERVELHPGYSIGVFDYTLKLLEPARIGIAVADRHDLTVSKEFHLVPGSAIIAYESPGGLVVEAAASLSEVKTEGLGGNLTVLFYYDGDEPTFAILANPAQEQVLLDRGLIRQNALYLRPFDTIEFGTTRIEVLNVGQASIVCDNPGCRVVNAVDAGSHCRLCGTPLNIGGPTLRQRRI
ncbi:MAG: FHA domain-containing protein [Ancalomicrobiaceae bacterium]|nr:FHA domain-containing protein [Ancalomicrobiaceae bacterium]